MKVSQSIIVLALACAANAVHADDKAATNPAAFVDKAAQAGMAEVALGKLALEKSNTPEIQKFAQRMVTDHTKANAELTALAKTKGMEPPAKLDSKHAAMVESLESQDGAAFDAAYAQHMNMDHSKAIELFEGAAKSPDADLATFAKKTLPTLKEHKAMAEKLPRKAAR
jgi:putative membrane protein